MPKRTTPSSERRGGRPWLEPESPQSGKLPPELRKKANVRAKTTKLQNHLNAKLVASDSNASHHQQQILQSIDWIRSHVPVTLLRSQRFSQQWGVEALGVLIQKILVQKQAHAFGQWQRYVQTSARLERARQVHGPRIVQILTQAASQMTQFWFQRWIVEIQYQLAQERHAAATEIQSVFQRRYRPRHDHSTRACVIIQCTWRRRQARVQAHLCQCNECASRVQRRFRFWLERQRIKGDKKVKESTTRLNLARHASATCIQCFARVIAAQELRRQLEHEKAARCLQSFFHTFYPRPEQRPAVKDDDSQHGLSQDMMQLAQYIALDVLTSNVRRFLDRRARLRSHHRHTSALVIQTKWRQTRACDIVTKLRMQRHECEQIAAFRIQTCWKVYRQRQRRAVSRLNETCRPLFLRALTTQDRVLFQQEFRLAIQESAASYLAQTWKRYCADQKTKARLATAIQARWRGNSGRNISTSLAQDRAHQAQLEHRSIVMLQSTWRGNQGRLEAQALAQAQAQARFDRAVVKIQSIWRARRGKLAFHIQCQALWATKKRHESASRVLQRFGRAMVTKKRTWTEILNHMKMEEQARVRRENAARCIQRFIRPKIHSTLAHLFQQQVQLDLKRRERLEERRKIIHGFIECKTQEREEEAALQKLIDKNAQEQQAYEEQYYYAAHDADDGIYEDHEDQNNWTQETLEVQEEVAESQPVAADDTAASGWVEYIDESSGYPYYYHSETGETRW